MSSTREDLRDRIDTIESSYEFMLAYAAQGLPTDVGARSGGQIRTDIGRLTRAVEGLAPAFHELVEGEVADEEHATYLAFLNVLADDARKALAAIRLVSMQAALSSQLIDNLNASIHVRALLTDVFLLDEMLKILGSDTPAAAAPDADPAG